MKRITRQDKANEAAEQWAQQCERFGLSNDWHYTILKRLKALGESPDPNMVDAIIGNTSWTSVDCSECSAINIPVVRFECGDDTFYLCENCLTEALRLLREHV